MSLPVVLEPGASWGTRFTTYRAALAAAQKPGAGVPAYMRWVNRGAARVAAAAELLMPRYAGPGDDIRVDVILLAPGTRPRHIENAWIG